MAVWIYAVAPAGPSNSMLDARKWHGPLPLGRGPRRIRRPKGQFSASFKPLPALHFGSLAAGMSIASPVRGLRPVDAAREDTRKVPKPTKRTSVPSRSDAVIASRTASIALAASAFDSAALAETTLTRSF